MTGWILVDTRTGRAFMGPFASRGEAEDLAEEMVAVDHCGNAWCSYHWLAAYPAVAR